MVNKFKELWANSPLRLILFLGLIARLVAVIFSKGYGMHDDHFLIIEASKSWVEGYDYNDWLPKKGVLDQQASGHSFFYVGLHYLLFLLLKFIHLTDPQNQMYVVRLLHALLSLIVVASGYKIALKIAGEKPAKVVGMILALYWIIPFLSVRNLVEVVCVIPLIYATWVVVKNDSQDRLLPFVWAGVLLGIAFSIRFQTILFTGGFGLALLLLKQYKAAIVVGLLFLLLAAGVQGGIDILIWGRPFVEFSEYVRYNLENATSYSTQPWYLYLLFLSGILIPPVSLFFLFGFFKSWKKHLLLFLPSFIFLAFHSYFPNKQERFIYPIIPFVITLGYVGWYEYSNASGFWQKNKKLMRGCWIWFWVLNMILLPVISTAYSKRNRVEAMVYLSQKDDLKRIVIEDSNRDGFTMPPLFYLDKWQNAYGITKVEPAAHFYNTYKALPEMDKPNYVVFMQNENIDARVDSLTNYFPTLTYETTVEPSAIDKLVHWLNPVNKNQTTYIYKIK